jgi:hypothetical protein
MSDVILDAIDDAAFCQAVQAAASLPPTHADAVIRYMRLFGNIRHPAYAKLLGDLAEAISTGQFSHKRQVYKASPALWLAALTDTVASTTIRLPLKAANGHGFLFAIAAAKADQAAARAEQLREEQLRQATTERREMPAVSESVSADELRRRELEADIRHWESQLLARPGDNSIVAILASVRAKLASEHPPISSTPV